MRNKESADVQGEETSSTAGESSKFVLEELNKEDKNWSSDTVGGEETIATYKHPQGKLFTYKSGSGYWSEGTSSSNKITIEDISIEYKEINEKYYSDHQIIVKSNNKEVGSVFVRSEQFSSKREVNKKEKMSQVLNTAAKTFQMSLREFIEMLNENFTMGQGRKCLHEIL